MQQNIQARVSKEDKEVFIKFADEQGMTISGFVERACKEMIRRHYANKKNNIVARLQRIKEEASEMYDIVSQNEYLKKIIE